VKQTNLQRRSSVLERDIGSNFTILRYYSGIPVARASYLKKSANNFCKEDELKLSQAQNPADFYMTLTKLKRSDWETRENGIIKTWEIFLISTYEDAVSRVKPQLSFTLWFTRKPVMNVFRNTCRSHGLLSWKKITNIKTECASVVLCGQNGFSNIIGKRNVIICKLIFSTHENICWCLL
jgi:hypothetical protein